MSTDLLSLLGGAKRKKTRVRGLAPWRPQAKTVALLLTIQLVLEVYADYLPLTVRQLFYRLVATHDYPKTELAYERLGEVMNRARRAGVIPWEAIRDDGLIRVEPQTFLGAQDFLLSIQHYADDLQLARQEGQPETRFLWSEAAGMVPQLALVARDYGIPVLSKGGFDSTTVKRALAHELSQEPRPVEVLHLGDHDGSGAHVVISLAEDVQKFLESYGGEVRFTRLAVTPEQIRDLKLPTKPPKDTDKRAFTGQTCQLEAIAPDVLARIVRNAIEERLDPEPYNAVLEEEREERRKLGIYFKRLRLRSVP